MVQAFVPMIIDRPYLKDLVMLFLASYIFLLRLPSEGLPLAAHEAPAGVHDPVPVLSVTECEIVVDFPFRKNRLHPSRQVRAWGHAEDLLQAGGSLADILAAGDWRSAAFLDYLNKERLVRDRIAEAHAAVTASDSSSNEEPK